MCITCVGKCNWSAPQSLLERAWVCKQQQLSWSARAEPSDAGSVVQGNLLLIVLAPFFSLSKMQIL